MATPSATVTPTIAVIREEARMMNVVYGLLKKTELSPKGAERLSLRKGRLVMEESVVNMCEGEKNNNKKDEKRER